MKTLVILLLGLVAATGSSFAQNLITLQSGENATFYTNLDTALFYAKNGDDIYLPGGYIKANSETLKIDKAVNIIGVGYNPYTNSATENTIIQCSIEIMPNVNGGSISGINNNHVMRIHNAVSNFSVNRCLISTIYISDEYASIQPTNIIISETIVNTIIGNVNYLYSGPQNVLISNCILGKWDDNYALYCNRSWVELTCKNCIIFGVDNGGGTGLIQNISNSVFENCILVCRDNIRPGGDNNKFKNCVFTMSNPETFAGNTNLVFNSIFDQAPNSIFIDPQNFIFNMKNNYNLREDSPGKNAGRDGTDIGIYGGIFPWKDGGLPVNPHFQQVQVRGTTDANGNLNVNIKVEAQER